MRAELRTPTGRRSKRLVRLRQLNLVTVVFYHLTLFSYRCSPKGLFLDTLNAQKQKKDFYLNQSGHAMSRATLYHHLIDFLAVNKVTWSKHSSFFRTLYRGHMISVKTETTQKRKTFFHF